MAEKNKNSNAEAARTLLEKNRRIFEGDRTLWIIYTVLLVVSVLVVYSSTAKMAFDITSKMTTTDSLRQQIMFVVLAIPTIFIVHKIDYKVFMRLTPLFYYLFIGLTIATYFIGTTTNGAARWIAIGPIQFQPSEGLKILTILMLARRMESRQGNIDKLNILPTSWRLTDPKQQRIIRENTIPLLGPIILSCVVIVPAHTSTAVLIFLVSVVMLYIGRVRLRELVKFTFILGAVGVLGLGAMSMVGMGRGDTASGRFSTWAQSWIGDDKVKASYELSDTQRAMIAIRNGGLFGEGAGHSTSRAVVIHPESDYAYAFFVSEYGLIISLILMLLYLWVFFRSMEICKKCKTAFPALMTLGLGLLITCQALLHIFVQINIMPETGQTLPLISRGGTSLLFTTLAFGMIISVSRTNQLREENERNKTR